MSEKTADVRHGSHCVVEIDGKFHVLFQPDDLPWHFVCIAMFKSRKRADAYAEIEQMANAEDWSANDTDVLALKAIPYPAASPPVKLDRDGTKPATNIPQIIPEPEANHTEPALEPQYIKDLPEPEAPKQPERESHADDGKSRQISTDSDASRQILPEAPIVQNVQSVQNVQPEPPAKPKPAFGMSMPEKRDRLMAVLRETAEPGDGRVPLSLAQMHKRSGVAEGSLSAVLKELEADKLIRRAAGVTYVPRPPVVTNGQTPAPEPAPLPKSAAFDSMAPKPEWDFGKDRLVVQAPRMATGVPDRLAVSGSYLVCGNHNIRLSKEQAIIAARLIKDWGSPVPKHELAEEIISRSVNGGSVKAALEHIDLKPLAEINTLIKPAGLVVFETAGKWRLECRQEAGATA